MKTLETSVQFMYDTVKELYKEEGEYMDIYDLKRFYNRICELFNLDIAFGIDGNEDGGDDSIYCYIYENGIGSIVFNRNCKRYDDKNFYKDTVNYLLELENEGHEISNKLYTLTNNNHEKN